jgi:hypothetical protein
MKMAVITTAAGLIGIGAGLCACGAAPVTVTQSPPVTVTQSPHTPATSPAAAGPATTKTVVKVKTVPASPATHASVAPAPATSASPAAVPATTVPAAPQQPPDENVTAPWAVVSAYYGDIESGDYAQAYALIGDGATTGQSYQDFVAGFGCTGAQGVSENWQSGDQVNFDLAAGDSCTGATTQYTGTDTVQNGIIVAADVVQTS